jgi:hypothetical protein
MWWCRAVVGPCCVLPAQMVECCGGSHFTCFTRFTSTRTCFTLTKRTNTDAQGVVEGDCCG